MGDEFLRLISGKSGCNIGNIVQCSIVNSQLAQQRLVLEAGATRYELEPTRLTYRYMPEGSEELQTRSGIFTLEQLLESPFHLTLSIFQMPAGEWTGNWLVTNEDGSQLCTGSIDLLPPE